MTSAIVHLKLQDYKEWRTLFDNLSPARKDVGSTGGTLYRSSGCPDEVVVVMNWRDLSSAHEFCDMPDWQAVIRSHSVAGMPEIFYSDVCEKVDF